MKEKFKISLRLIIIIAVLFLGFSQTISASWTNPTLPVNINSNTTVGPLRTDSILQAKGGTPTVSPSDAILQIFGGLTTNWLSLFGSSYMDSLKMESFKSSSNPGVTYPASVCVNAVGTLYLCDGTLPQDYYSLTVSKLGAGSGTVTSSPSGINCGTGAGCIASFLSGTSVELTATAGTGSIFASWSDCDSVNGLKCTVVMNNDKVASVTFNTSSSLPAINSPTATGMTQNSAILGATVTNLGNPPMTERGTCYGSSANPRSNCLAEGGTSLGIFTHTRTGLSSNTTYHYVGYAKNSGGTVYTSDATFTTTQSGFLPSISNPTATNITQTSATLGANVTNVGNPAMTAKGVCYGLTANPTYPSSASSTCKSRTEMVTGAFTVSATSLTANTTYHYRGYAINSVGTAYTSDTTFTTTQSGGGSCAVTTDPVTEITQTSAKANGTVTSGTNPYRGFVMNTSQNPTLENNWWLGGIFVPSPQTGTGAYSSQMGVPPLAPLSPGVTYYVRAYCQLTGQTTVTYGSNVSFTTPSGANPTVSTSPVDNITQTSAMGHGSVTTNGGTVTERGLVWGRYSGPRTWDNCSGGNCNKYVISSSGGGAINGAINKDIPWSSSALTPGTKYYVRAYAIVQGYPGYDPKHPTELDPEHLYGNQVEFTTLPPPLIPCNHGQFVKNTPGTYNFSFSNIPGFPCTGTIAIKIFGAGGGGGGGSGGSGVMRATLDPLPGVGTGSGGGGGGEGGSIGFLMSLTEGTSNVNFSGNVGNGGNGGDGGEAGWHSGGSGVSGGSTTLTGSNGTNITAFGGGGGGGSSIPAAPFLHTIAGSSGSGGGISGLSSIVGAIEGQTYYFNGADGVFGQAAWVEPHCYSVGGHGGSNVDPQTGGDGGLGGGAKKEGCVPRGDSGDGGNGGLQTYGSGGGGGGGGGMGSRIWIWPGFWFTEDYSGGGGGNGANGRVQITW